MAVSLKVTKIQILSNNMFITFFLLQKFQNTKKIIFVIL